MSAPIQNRNYKGAVLYGGSEQTQTCQKCGDTKKTAVPATGHTYQTTVVQASVNKDGQIITKCTKCGDTKTVTIYAPKTIRLSKNRIYLQRKGAEAVRDRDGQCRENDCGLQLYRILRERKQKTPEPTRPQLPSRAITAEP